MEYILKSGRIGLRAWQPSDTPLFIKMNQDSDVMRHFTNISTADQTKELITRLKKHQDDHGYTFFAAEILSTQDFIGFIGLVNTSFETDFTPAVEIGWRLRKEYWGHGYATEGAQACLSFAFQDLGMSEIISFTTLSNKPSESVMQRIGMRPKGTFFHPKIDVDHPMCEHLLYQISRDGYLQSLSIM